MISLRFLSIIWGLTTALFAQDARDAFATPEALGLIESGALVEGSYQGARIEVGEAALYSKDNPYGWTTIFNQSIWFTFSVPSDGIWHISVGHPSDLAEAEISYPIVFEEAPLSGAQSLFPVWGKPRASKCLLKTGLTYRLGLRTESTARSYFKVAFQKLQAPANDHIAEAQVVAGNSVVIRPSGATLEVGEIRQIEGVLGTAWVRWTAPSAGVWLLKSPTIRTGLPWPPTPAPLFPGPPADTEPSSFWSPLGSNAGRKFSLFASAAVNDPASPLDQGGSWILFNAEAGQEFWIAGYDHWYGEVTIPLELELASPNDARERARHLGSASAIHEKGHFLGATISPGESLPASFPVARTVWLSWTARSSGLVNLQVSSLGGPSVAIQSFAGNEPIGSAPPSSWGREWQFNATKNETYFFQISATADPRSSFQFSMLADEPADRFDEAIHLDRQALASTVRCTLEPGEPPVGAGEGSVWLRWYSATRSVVRINLKASQAIGHAHDTRARMEIYTGGTVSSLVPVTDSTLPTVAHFVAEAGMTYHIRVMAASPTDGVAQVTLRSQLAGIDLEQLLAEVGALVAMAGAGRNEEALALVNQVLVTYPDEPRAAIAAAYLELRLATKSPSGRIIASRIVPSLTNLMPVHFRSSEEAGPDGEIPGNLSLANFLTNFDTETWPHLSTALSHLSSITEPSPTFSHSELPVYPMGRGGSAVYQTDAHDRRTVIAMLMAVRGTLDYLASLDGTVPAEDFFGWLCDGLPTLESLLDKYPAFLTLNGQSDRRPSASSWFKASSEQAQIAESLYQKPLLRNFDPSLFTINSVGGLGLWFSWVKSANGPTTYAGYGLVDVSRWLSSTKSPRSLLPAVVGNRFRAYSAPDITFGGLLPNAKEAEMHKTWVNRGWLAHYEEIDQWLTRHFPIETPTAGDDPDGDGISLAHEYAFGLSPMLQDPLPYQPDFGRQQLQDGTWQSQFSFRRRIALKRSHYQAFRSNDLRSWTAMPVPEDAEADATPGFERVTLAVPDGQFQPDAVFFKLKFSRVPSWSGSISYGAQ